MNKYRFWMEVRDALTGKITMCEWSGLTLTAAKVMYKATAENYVYTQDQGLSCGWEEMK